MGVTTSSLTLLSTEAEGNSRNSACCGSWCSVPGSQTYMTEIDLEALWGRRCYCCLLARETKC